MKLRSHHLIKILLASSTIVSGCHGNQNEQPIALTPVNVQVQGIGGNPASSDQISYSSTIEADKSISISPQVSGTLLSIPIEVGQYVQKGQLIATIDETVYRSQYNAQMAQVNLAKETYDRILTVYNQGSVAEIRMLSAKADYEQASAAARAAYQNIVHCKIYAPQSGYIGTKNMEAGSTASPGISVAQIFDINTVSVYVPIPENEINAYKTGLAAGVKVSAFDDKIFTGKVDKIAIAPSSQAPVYTVQVKINNSENLLKPGMSCNVLFKNNSSSAKQDTANDIIIPLQALQVDEQKQNFVFVTDASSQKAVRKNVATGGLYENGIAIKSGLQSGDKLIISGFHKITDGSSIHVIN